VHVDGKAYRTIQVPKDDPACVEIIDQRALPHAFLLERLRSAEDVAVAIEEMHVRGAPLIGAAAAYGLWLAALQHPNDPRAIPDAASRLRTTRPTAVDLQNAVDRVLRAFRERIGAPAPPSGWQSRPDDRTASAASAASARSPAASATMARRPAEEPAVDIARRTADAIVEESIAQCERIGEAGLGVLERLSREREGRPVRVLTHCNAGWLATVDRGTALAPVYAAKERGVPVHVYVDETRPRNQGASLTAWELGQEGVSFDIIADNAAGHLMARGEVDCAIVGADRVLASGHVANKIGTYEKALAAFDNAVPFYVAFPQSTIDWQTKRWEDIPIEERAADEVRFVHGRGEDGRPTRVLVAPPSARVRNPAFDITPPRLCTGFLTDRGLCKPTSLAEAFAFTRSVEPRS
jgi:methylthioribose-1-phosphate isomerase